MPVVFTSPVGARRRRPKWFGIPTTLLLAPSIGRIAEETGESIPTTVGRVVAVLAWMAEYEPDGVMPVERMVAHMASMGGRFPRRNKFAAQFVSEFTGEDGLCDPFVVANKAAMNLRSRQRETMRRNRGES